MDEIKKKKLITALLSATTGIGIATVTAVLITFEKLYGRYDRPNYDAYPGAYNIKYYPKLKRELLKVKSLDNNLQAYYYEAKRSKGLVVLSHGYHAGADDYLPMIDYLVNHRYSVFTFDVTGTYDSSGDGVVGMCQSLVDLDNVFKFLENENRFKNMKYFTLGHSWGGYAASSILCLKDNIKASALIAPMYSGATIMAEKAEYFAGNITKLPMSAIIAFQKVLFGDYTKYNGVLGINKNNIPVLIAQGLNDEIIPIEASSILTHKKDITNPNVKYILSKGLLGSHDGIWHSKRSNIYIAKINTQLKQAEEIKGSKLTDKEKAMIVSQVDQYKYSEVNKILMKKIIKLFNKAK